MTPYEKATKKWIEYINRVMDKAGFVDHVHPAFPNLILGIDMHTRTFVVFTAGDPKPITRWLPFNQRRVNMLVKALSPVM